MTAEGTRCHSGAVLEEPSGHSRSERGTEERVASAPGAFPSPSASLQLCVVKGVSLPQPHFLTRWGDQVSQNCYFEVNNYCFHIS